MDANQGTSVALLDELDTWLHSCNICLEVAINPIATTCGHLFCRSCLNKDFQGKQAWLCPVCRADLLEETMRAFPINIIGALVEPTSEAANTEMPDSRNQGPTSCTPMTTCSSPISTMRMNVVDDKLKEVNKLIHKIQLTLNCRVSNLRDKRIQHLEQVVDNLVQINLSMLREIEDCKHDMRRMSCRIVELENPVVHEANAFIRRQQQVRRIITPTPVVAGNDEGALGSIEER